MSFLTRIKWFQKTATGIVVLFMGLMLLVVIVAYSRRSGNTGLDMAKIYQIRHTPKSPTENTAQK